jgi:hypothetical protein
MPAHARRTLPVSHKQVQVRRCCLSVANQLALSGYITAMTPLWLCDVAQITVIDVLRTADTERLVVRIVKPLAIPSI